MSVTSSAMETVASTSELATMLDLSVLTEVEKNACYNLVNIQVGFEMMDLFKERFPRALEACRLTAGGRIPVPVTNFAELQPINCNAKNF